jgi:hypothetical protein
MTTSRLSIPDPGPAYLGRQRVPGRVGKGGGGARSSIRLQKGRPLNLRSAKLKRTWEVGKMRFVGGALFFAPARPQLCPVLERGEALGVEIDA